jgi:MFS superfamily sulfate permease-like transporter
MNKMFKNWKQDLPASLVVFLVALPLCLGVALASTKENPNLFAGIIAGVVGGIVVGVLSGSRLGVSGPAAGLITIVAAAIATIGSYEGFLLAVVISGFIQIVAGFLKAGVLGNYFPSSVIKGMLAAIGLTLILKEIPHAFGYDKNFMGSESFAQLDGQNTFSEILLALQRISPGAVIISIVSISILILFDKPFMKRFALFKILPGALFVVVFGIVINLLFSWFYPSFYMKGEHLVQLPIAQNMNDFVGFFKFPDFSHFKNPDVYVVALTIALVGSLETLLSVEATDKLDPEKFHTPTNRELKAQGVGNMISGFLGGLPITQVIVRSSANIDSGGKSKLSTIMHGVLLFACVLLLPVVLNMIPLASLGSILLMVGYKLSKVGLYKQMYRLGWEQFIPFIITIIGVLFTDLLKGIFIGIAISIFFILRKNYKNNYEQVETSVEGNKVIKLILSEEVTFLNKSSIIESLQNLEPNSHVIIDGSSCVAIDHDVLEVIQEFKCFSSKEKNILVETIKIPEVQILGAH